MACDPLDVACNLSQALLDIIMPVILVIIVLLVAIFVLPKAGKKGVVLSLLIIAFIVFWYGLIPGIPSLKSLLGGG